MSKLTAHDSLNNRFFSIYQGEIGFMEAWIIENGLSYTPGQWCNVKIFFDFEENVSHFVIDNQYIGTRARLQEEVHKLSPGEKKTVDVKPVADMFEPLFLGTEIQPEKGKNQYY